MPRKSKTSQSAEKQKPHVNKELEGFDIQINEFGEIHSSYNLQNLNKFLDSKVDDKKFRGIDVVRRAEDAATSSADGEEPAAD